MKRTTIPKFVRELKPAPSGKRLTLPVPGVPSLYVRVSDRGVKTFTIVARPEGASNPKYQRVPLILDMIRGVQRGRPLDSAVSCP